MFVFYSLQNPVSLYRVLSKDHFNFNTRLSKATATVQYQKSAHVQMSQDLYSCLRIAMGCHPVSAMVITTDLIIFLDYIIEIMI